MARLPDLPVFPLPLVLLPGELLPLHIFEPRYRELVARCLAGPEPFCVVLEDGAGMREIGCLARDLTVLERLADGRLNIVVSGGEPVRLGPIDENAHAYLSAEALVLEDDVEPLAEDEMEAALTAYRALLSELGREDPEPLSNQPRLAYALGARIDVGLQVGQALLESRSETARLVLITEALEQGRHSLRIAAERERRAVRNGKVEPTASDVP
jgi:Lon protease-like protein